MTPDEAFRILENERMRDYRRRNIERMRAAARARYAKKVGRPVRKGNYRKSNADAPLA